MKTIQSSKGVEIGGMMYYDGAPIFKLKAQYKIIFGERSNGKTYAAKLRALEKFVESGYKSQSVYLRRWDEDIKGNRGSSLFDDIVKNGKISELTGGEYELVYYRNREFFLANYDEDKDKVIPMKYPFMKALSLSVAEHNKSTSMPYVDTVIFDEFLTNKAYLTNEFIEFTKTLSTILRSRDDIEILMLANTVNKSSPYFREMGLGKIIKNIQQGTIEQHKSKKGTKYAIEYCGRAGLKSTLKKPSDIYFGFDNPRMNMITEGAWEVGNYPHLDVRFHSSNIRYFYYIIWEEEVLKCDIVKKNGTVFTYIHLSDLTPEDIIKKDDITGETYIENLDNKHRVYHVDQMIFPNWHCNLVKERHDKIGTVISEQFKQYKVYYEDNSTGQTVDNYVKWCLTN